MGMRYQDGTARDWTDRQVEQVALSWPRAALASAILWGIIGALVVLGLGY